MGCDISTLSPLLRMAPLGPGFCSGGLPSSTVFLVLPLWPASPEGGRGHLPHPRGMMSHVRHVCAWNLRPLSSSEGTRNKAHGPACLTLQPSDAFLRYRRPRVEERRKGRGDGAKPLPLTLVFSSQSHLPLQKFFVFKSYVGACFICVYIYVHIHVYSGLGDRKRLSDPLQLELHRVMSHHVGSGTLDPLIAEPSWHPLTYTFKSASNLALVACPFHPALTPIFLSLSSLSDVSVILSRGGLTEFELFT